jgi:hydrogenase/urease accessory protein HupE
VPFSYLDLRIDSTGVDVSVVAHAYDLSHDLGLGVESPGRLLDSAILQAEGNRIGTLLGERLTILGDGRPLSAGEWSLPEPLHDRQSVRLQTRYESGASLGSVTVSAHLFPYDPEHQTFVNFYDTGELASQAILGESRSEFEYFMGTRQGAVAVVRKFLPAGIHHILIGPDHLLFLVGLLLLGGSMRHLALIVSAFTLAHSVTLSIAALGFVTPPGRIIEPAIALSIVYVGADNLMVRGGRDMRGWIAFAFGFIHGFGFATVLREMDLPSRALGWSLFSFNLGVEVGQLAVVVAVASLLALVRARSEAAGRRLALAGSVVVIAAGSFWFIQRVFFAGGIP